MGSIVTIPGSAVVYLCVEGIWYCYDSSRPPLGEGAIGIVYLGFRCDNQDRVAIKRINDNYVNNPVIRGMVRYEASMVFSHPNIVRVIGLCEDANGIGGMYLICEYVPGITFKDRAMQLSVISQVDATKQVVEDVRALLLGLEYLHKNGFIHRDIKPSNVMIDNSANVKLMDLGTIIAIDQMQRNTQLEFVGTPSYASPEQIRCMPCDARSDIYSIGLVLYELLTGENPFDGSTRDEIFNKQLYMSLPQNDALPLDLYNIIKKATNKNVEERFASVGELDAALSNYLYYKDVESSLRAKESNILIAVVAAVAALLLGFLLLVL